MSSSTLRTGLAASWRHARPREVLTVARRPGERNRPGR